MAFKIYHTGAQDAPAPEITGWRAAMVSVFLFSCVINALMFTGPMFMLQVYDRVLTSRSEQTLAGLFVLVTAVYMLMACLIGPGAAPWPDLRSARASPASSKSRRRLWH